MENWFVDTAVGIYAAAREKQFFEQNAPSEKSVAAQMGLRIVRPSESIVQVPDEVAMKACAMAWQTRSLDALLLPHTHEYSACPLSVLTEAARVLKPEGRLIITGFNPYSLWSLGGWFDGKRLPERNRCFALPEFKRKLHALGFETEYGRFMAYVPPVYSERALDFWRFMDKAGDRWWPQCAAIYGLVCVKRVTGMTPLPEWETLLADEPAVLGAARLHSGQ